LRGFSLLPELPSKGYLAVFSTSLVSFLKLIRWLGIQTMVGFFGGFLS
jgi:hypothetical protein